MALLYYLPHFIALFCILWFLPVFLFLFRCGCFTCNKVCRVATFIPRYILKRYDDTKKDN